MTAGSQEQNVGGGKSESAPSLLKEREVSAVAEQWHYSSVTGREDAAAFPLFLLFLVGTVTVTYTSL